MTIALDCSLLVRPFAELVCSPGPLRCAALHCTALRCYPRTLCPAIRSRSGPETRFLAASVNTHAACHGIHLLPYLLYPQLLFSPSSPSPTAPQFFLSDHIASLLHQLLLHSCTGTQALHITSHSPTPQNVCTATSGAHRISQSGNVSRPGIRYHSLYRPPATIVRRIPTPTLPLLSCSLALHPLALSSGVQPLTFFIPAAT